MKNDVKFCIDVISAIYLFRSIFNFIEKNPRFLVLENPAPDSVNLISYLSPIHSMVDSKETFSHFIFIAVIKNTNYFVYVILQKYTTILIVI